MTHVATALPLSEIRTARLSSNNILNKRDFNIHINYRIFYTKSRNTYYHTNRIDIKKKCIVRIRAAQPQNTQQIDGRLFFLIAFIVQTKVGTNERAKKVLCMSNAHA